MIHRSFYFIRHGETDWNRQQKLQGTTDIPLNDTGIEQARAAVRTVGRLGITRILTSDLSRARHTADIINAALSVPLHVDAGLRERGFGIFEGKQYEEMQALRLQLKEQGAPLEESGYPRVPEAEPYADFKTRVVGSINAALTAYADETLLFVAHGGVYRVLRRALFGVEDQCDNARALLFDRRADGGWQLDFPA